MKNLVLVLSLLVYVFGICETATINPFEQNPAENKPDHTKKNEPELKRTSVFTHVLPELRKTTKVPLRLPTKYIFGGEGLFAIIDSVDTSSYQVQLAFDEDCRGQNVCHEATFIGSLNPIVLKEGMIHPIKRVPVVLHGGIKGYFIDSQCGAYCDESVIVWKQNGYHYSFGIKAGRKNVLIEIVNSAIVLNQISK